MSVYFVQDGDLIKIGFSSDVRRRVASIINGLHGNGMFLGCMPGGREIESHLHATFAQHHEYGEWFRINDRLLTLIAMVAGPTAPDDKSLKSPDRLQQQEERYAEEGAYFINLAMAGLSAGDRAIYFARLAEMTTIPEERLRAIHRGAVCPITAGEYVILRMMRDAADPDMRLPSPNDDECSD